MNVVTTVSSHLRQQSLPIPPRRCAGNDWFTVSGVTNLITRLTYESSFISGRYILKHLLRSSLVYVVKWAMIF